MTVAKVPPVLIKYPMLSDALATVSAATAGLTWLDTLNAGLQVIATLTAIVAGYYAIKAKRAQLRNLSEDRDESE